MKLRIFSVVGEALNFGLRRMETIVRVAWLPVVLLLLVEMVTVFGYLSVAVGRLVTFSDVLTYMQAQEALAKMFGDAWRAHTLQMAGVTIASLVVIGVLISSFMAPLIRYAGLGERPSSGVVKLDFGADQVRFFIAGIFSFLVMAALVYVPIGATAYYVFKYILTALSQTFASFPNPESLHTIKFVPAAEVYAERGSIWIFQRGIPLIAAAPFAALLWALFTAHFYSQGRNVVFQAIKTMAALIIVVATFWLAFNYLATLQHKTLIALVLTIISPLLAVAYFLSSALAPDQLAIVSVVALLGYYFSLRITPYQGIVVCRRSMAPAGFLRVTRGGNVVRLLAITFLIGALTSIAVFLINTYFLVFVGVVSNLLYQATATATKLTGSGVEADWVRPLFAWIWNGFKIIVNLFLTFFQFGVLAGLLGRLYRESERTD